MRISDWSSDVCSSDLFRECGDRLSGSRLRAGRILVHLSVSIGRGAPQATHPECRFRANCLQSHSCSPPVENGTCCAPYHSGRSEEHTSELQSLMRISYAVFCLKKKNNKTNTYTDNI